LDGGVTKRERDARDPSRGERWLRRLATLLLYAGVLVAVFIMLSMTAAVLSRRFLGEPLAWTLEVTEHLLLYVAFLGAGAVSVRDAHVRLEMLPRAVPKSVIRWLDLFAELLAILVAITVFGASLWITTESYAQGTPTGGILGFPRWVALVSIPLGSAMLAFAHFERLLLRRRGQDLEAPPEEERLAI
jgi:C4-dicarboxylate transporter DctQ subunit